MTLQVISSFIGFIFCLQSVKADNQISLDMRVNPANRLVFSLSYGKEPVILESFLGLNVDNQVLGENAKMIDKVEGVGGYVVYTLQQTEGTIFHIDTRVSI